MTTDALSVANYFVELSLRDNVDLKQYGLIKRVYITHGCSLGYMDRSALDPRFDVVEAWKHGPVIPSLYHSFKHHGNNPIREKCFIMEYDGNGEGVLITPELTDVPIRKMADEVWKVYKHMSDREVVELLHREGTPWALCYEPGKTNPIPDLYTKVFYRNIFERTQAKRHGKKVSA
jgi:uncharacterized phage-associated protein